MPITRTSDAKQTSRFLVLGSVFVVVAALYFAQEVLIPIALAVLLSFLLAPLVRVLERVKLPRAAAVLLSVLLAFAVLSGIGFVVYNQLADLTTRLPGYSQNVQRKIAGMQGPGGMVSWFSHTSAAVKKVLDTSATKPSSQPAAAATSGPPPSSSAEALGDIAGDAIGGPPPQPGNVQKVEVVNSVQGGMSPLAVLRSVAGDILGPAGTAFIVVVFTIFMLLQREDLRDRVIRLVGRERVTTTTQALDDAAQRVSKYLLLQSIVNGSVGVVIFALLWVVGKMAGTPFPSPALWGLLSALLRFIPFVGIWISALMPVLLSLAVYASFKWTLVTVGVYLFTELMTANAIEPMLFGSSTGIGTLAVLVAAAFWAWLWGPVGLLLSTPLTVCLVVMGKYVPALEFLNVLLSDEPALSPPDRVYQRLMALDAEEAADLIHDYAKKLPLEELYDTVLLPALAMSEGDAARGQLDDHHRSAIRRGVSDLVEELGDRHKREASKAVAQHQVDLARGHAPADEPAGSARVGGLAAAPPGTRVMLPKGCQLNVVCLPADNDADELAAVMLGQLLELRGYCVTIVSAGQLAAERVDAAVTARPDIVVVSALPPAAVTHARYLCKRLHERAADLSLLVGLWTSAGDLQRARDRISCGDGTRLAGGLRQAIDELHQAIQPKLINAAMAVHAAN